MITFIIRNPTEEEKLGQIKRLPGAYKRFESFILKFIFVNLLLLIPLLIYNRYHPFTSKEQLDYSVIIIMLTIFLCLWWTKKDEDRNSNRKQTAAINSTKIEVVKVKTSRAIKREDPEDFGIAYYIDVMDGRKRKTLYLWGQYLDDLEYDNLFPCTEFEFIRQLGSEEFIDFKPMGQYFKPERVLQAFTKEVWESGSYPVNGQLLSQPIDTIK